ncbi:glycosyltransferase [Chryseobacterium antibioticum]|uniref:Glycosyltransferase n=1 Tax=Chryseobacterium pyrolae TaxID=2987481 RepID=A0ABT2ILK9_9FLAO|nr:glycosyltransferase [Chryseobacterium pyrolae]MCT2409543.1 glycosyltransferase [Chryseobacterium pyrolae]
MNITFIGGLFPDENMDFFRTHSKGIFQYAADVLQKNIIKGLENNVNQAINVITVPFLGDFPKACDLKVVNEEKWQNKGGQIHQVGFKNIKFLNEFSKYNALKKALENQFVKEKNEVDTIVIYGMFSYFLKLTAYIKKVLPDVKICMIVPDLPHLMGADNNKPHIKLYNTYTKSVVNRNIKHIDSYIFLSKYMEDYLNTNKPFDIIEGIYNTNEKNITESKEVLPTIFYSGTLALRYGIERLLESFASIKNDELRLWICGAGDGEEMVKEYSKKDNRIIFKGQLDRSEILKLQRKATLLINPRDGKDEFTKYSFPSKTIEYLSSGTPTILYKLKGIPEEYYDYCYTCDSDGYEGLRDTIIEVLDISKDERDIMGERAKKFILNNKNETVQSGKIIKLIKTLS